MLVRQSGRLTNVRRPLPLTASGCTRCRQALPSLRDRLTTARRSVALGTNATDLQAGLFWSAGARRYNSETFTPPENIES